MRAILIIARKELLSIARQRNSLLIMLLSPIVLVSIMALAFGGLGGDSPDFANIKIAVVNQDQGFSLQDQLQAPMPVSATIPSLTDVVFEVGGQSVNLGDELLRNQTLGLQADNLNAGDFSMNFGDQVAAILLSQPLTPTNVISGFGEGGMGQDFDFSAITCPLIAESGEGIDAFDGTLDELLDAIAVEDAAMARAGVVSGEYAAAVIIPPDFSARLAPDFGFGPVAVTWTVAISATAATTATGSNSGLVEVIANNATPISASIVRAVVEGIVGQFERVNVALSALALTTIDRVQAHEAEDLDLDALGPSLLNPTLITTTLQNVDASILSPLGCLILPGANTVQLEQQPLDQTQERSPFSMLMVVIGSGQAIFFALFTGVFGINSIYEDRRQGTLQRVLVAPVTSSQVLFGRLLGNMVIVVCQLLILLTAFLVIVSLVEGQFTSLWGTNPVALLVVVLGLGLFTTGLGVLVVGLANSSEQVQVIGPMVTLILGAFGGTFGALVPAAFAKISPTWWGMEAMRKLSAGELDIGINLLVLFGVGALFAVVGTYFFRRRMGL